MRRTLLPLVLFSAIGAVVVIVVLSGRQKDRAPTPSADEPAKKTASAPDRDPGWRKRRSTPTALSENRALSDLERALGRPDLSNAHLFRGKVCEQLDEILQSEKLTRNLLDAIKKHGIESDDLKRRDVVLPILRVLRHPEATAMIASEFFKARTEEERMMLLEAMAHDYHDPEVAAVWAIEKAINSHDAEDRERAFQVVKDFSNNDALVFKTARAIMEGTTRPKQAKEMLSNISMMGTNVPQAQDYMRKRLRNPHAEEVDIIAAHMDGWGTHKDAALLEALALEFPAIGDFLRERAEAVRMAIRDRERGERTEDDERRLQELEEERRKRAANKEDG